LHRPEDYRAAVLNALIWGLVQGLTEFLPVSSSGHLIIIPAFLNELGMDIEPPSLAVGAVLHLGTLAAVLIYYRAEVASVLRFRTSPDGRKIALLVGIGTIPALIGLPLADEVESLQQSVAAVGWQIVATGVILVIGQRLATGARNLLQGRTPDAIVVGIAQAIALIPGISRSGVTIAAGNGRRFEPAEAARFSFLLGIPAIAGAGFSQLFALPPSSGLTLDLVVGMVVAGISGYLAIAFMMKSLNRIGLYPFAIYCFVIGLIAVVFF
jgi:undecaprenyl-diphosphatase